MRCLPTAVIRPSQQRVETRYKSGDTSDIIKVIMDADAESDAFVDPEGVQCLTGRNNYETARNIWKFVRTNAKYRPDRSGLERVKSPGALFASGFGDCKSFSIAEAAMLRALGFRNIRYRFAAYSPGPYTHVYIVARIGGRDVVMDAVPQGGFDSEVRYHHKKDIPAAKPLGVAGIGGDISNTINFIGIGLAAFVLYKIFSD